MTSYDNWKTSPPDPDPTCPECDGDLDRDGECVCSLAYRAYLDDEDGDVEEPECKCTWEPVRRDDGPEDYVYEDYDEVEGKWKFYGPKGRR